MHIVQPTVMDTCSKSPTAFALSAVLSLRQLRSFYPLSTLDVADVRKHTGYTTSMFAFRSGGSLGNEANLTLQFEKVCMSSHVVKRPFMEQFNLYVYAKTRHLDNRAT